MGIHYLAVTITILALVSSLAHASDPSPLQDFCVAINDTKAAVFVNGMFCKDPRIAEANDFFYSGLQIPRNTSNPLGSTVSMVTVERLPGLNTLGISLVRIDYGLKGLNPPHLHPRSSEIFIVLEGSLYAGFVTSNPDNRLFTKVLNKGDVFVFPQGLVHFQMNVGKTKAVAMAAFGSQSPGFVTIANTMFGSNPPISVDVLTKTFQLDKKVIDYLQTRLWYNNAWRG